MGGASSAINRRTASAYEDWAFRRSESSVVWEGIVGRTPILWLGYERRAITEWFAHHDTSPITNLALDNTNLIPNHLARAHAQRFRDECRAEGVDPDSLN